MYKRSDVFNTNKTWSTKNEQLVSVSSGFEVEQNLGHWKKLYFIYARLTLVFTR